MHCSDNAALKRWPLMVIEAFSIIVIIICCRNRDGMLSTGAAWKNKSVILDSSAYCDINFTKLDPAHNRITGNMLKALFCT
uniref:Secreted protein n=1 Tax=Romanomermis culicivorax TaxID=13658 RepID=A0A915I1N3_ROMCU